KAKTPPRTTSRCNKARDISIRPMLALFTPPQALYPIPMVNFRIGLGYDLHRLVAGRPLVLGNITIPHEKGLDGHSDADVVIHALIDAITGAAGLPDVGQMFPNIDPKYKGMDSAKLLEATMQEFARTGYKIINTDII